jgi:Protein of unknown function (DUF2397)
MVEPPATPAQVDLDEPATTGAAGAAGVQVGGGPVVRRASSSLADPIRFNVRGMQSVVIDTPAGTAVGAFPARHLLLAADAADDHTSSWTQAPAAPVTARFREQGARAAVGRRTKTPDYTRCRSAARQARAAAAAARAEAEAGLRQRSGTRLGEWAALTQAELDLLLELLGAARRTSDRATRS